MNNHRSFYTKERHCPITRHILREGHAFENVRFQIIEKIKFGHTRTTKERERDFGCTSYELFEPGELSERDGKTFKNKPKQ